MRQMTCVAGEIKEKKVFIAVPMYDGKMNYATSVSLSKASLRYEDMTRLMSGSLLTHIFNSLWTAGLNARAEGTIRYFLMLHADIHVGGAGWLDNMIDDMRALDADILSGVVPLKGWQGLTSTAIGDPNNRWTVHRRLTMKEIYDLPETFSIKDTPYPDQLLMVNTGCLLVDFSKPWVDKVVFHIDDVNYQDENGKWATQVNPEDWNLSWDAAKLGAKIYATRKPPIVHFGTSSWSNVEVWGSWTEDEQMLHENQRIRIEEVA